jgi:hypothetical protein
MNKVLIILAVSILLLIPVDSVWSQDEEDYSIYPGYVDLSGLDGFKKSDKSVEIYLRKPLLSLVAALDDTQDQQLQQLIGNLVLIRVEQFEVTAKDQADLTGLIERTSKNLGKKKWDKLVRAVDKEEHVEIFIKMDKGTINGLLVMAFESGNEASFINIVGKLDLKLLGKLGAKFNLPGLDKVPPTPEVISDEKNKHP